jgi:hypothetical protein
MQIDDRHDLSAVNEHARQPRWASRDGLQPHARYDLVDATDIESQVIAANLKREYEHPSTPSC